jgi:NAD(P)-dependent dehydrogenase (short-subunit alcohol dehydrogenase family)
MSSTGVAMNRAYPCGVERSKDKGSAASGQLTRRQVLASTSVVVGGVAAGSAARAADAKASPTAQQGGQLSGKVAIVTGAARGIGRAIAVQMAANGADIVGLDLCAKILPVQEYAVTTRADLDETSRLVRDLGRRFLPVVGDVRDMKFLRSTAADIERQWGHFDIVVANAATQLYKPLLDMEDWEWTDVISNNLNGTANTIRAFAPTLVRRGGGRVIVIASMQGKHGSKNMASYSASKWGIIGLMKSAALELGAHKVTVNAVVPGLVDTPLTHNEARWRTLIGEVEATEHPPQKPTQQQAASVRAPHVPLKVPWLKPEDIAPAAVFLASDLASMVTGACYDVPAGDDANNMG